MEAGTMTDSEVAQVARRVGELMVGMARDVEIGKRLMVSAYEHGDDEERTVMWEAIARLEQAAERATESRRIVRALCDGQVELSPVGTTRRSERC
jgi:hypothetical protein